MNTNPESKQKITKETKVRKMPVQFGSLLSWLPSVKKNLPILLLILSCLCLAVNVALIDIRLNPSTGIAKVATDAGKYGQLKAGSIALQSLATPGAPTVTNVGTTGAATWTYKIVAKQLDGSYTAAGSAGSTTTGNATLTSSNYNHLVWTAVTGAASYDIYRTAHGTTPSTNGKIATVITNSYDDKAAAGNGATAPTQNTTGTLSGYVDSNTFTGGVGYTTDVPSTIDGFLSYLVGTGTGSGKIDTHSATLPQFIIDFTSLTVTEGYYGECKLVGDGSFVYFDSFSALAASQIHWTIAEDSDIWVQIGISDSPTKQQIINKLVAIGGGKITDLGSLKIRVQPSDFDLLPIKFNDVPIEEQNPLTTYLGNMPGSGFESGSNDIGILRQRGWKLVGAFAHFVAVPSSAGSTGTAGDVAYDSTHFYICTATNTWKRVAIATW